VDAFVMADSPSVVVDRRETNVTITLSRPDRRNALSMEVFEELIDAVEPLVTETAVATVVLTGSEGVFCVGGDLAARARGGGIVTSDKERSSQRLKSALRVVSLFASLPQVTIASINGACAGAGLSLASACDLRVAASSAKFNTAFLSAGASGDFAGIWHVMRLVGPGRARDLFLLPGPFSAAKAYEVGLLSEVVDDAELPARIADLTTELGGRAPLALRAIKENLVDAERHSLSEYLELEADRYLAVGASLDSIEAARAFLERRPPVFEGK
jgi:2-(1,2-epoxy-1,2-dihydrophenyl)acetyl-CoA isomerase